MLYLESYFLPKLMHSQCVHDAVVVTRDNKKVVKPDPVLGPIWTI